MIAPRIPVQAAAHVLPPFMVVQRNNALWTAHRISDALYSLPLAKAVAK